MKRHTISINAVDDPLVEKRMLMLLRRHDTMTLSELVEQMDGEQVAVRTALYSLMAAGKVELMVDRRVRITQKGGVGR